MSNETNQERAAFAAIKGYLEARGLNGKVGDDIIASIAINGGESLSDVRMIVIDGREVIAATVHGMVYGLGFNGLSARRGTKSIIVPPTGWARVRWSRWYRSVPGREVRFLRSISPWLPERVWRQDAIWVPVNRVGEEEFRDRQ